MDERDRNDGYVNDGGKVGMTMINVLGNLAYAGMRAQGSN